MAPTIFYDVTLRDGNQALRKPWNHEVKEKILMLLIRLGVQGSEIGYPGASDMDFECACKLAVQAPQGMIIGCLARTHQADIDAAVRALKHCANAKPLLHTFIGMSPSHMVNVLKMEATEVRARAVRMVRYAREQMGESADIQFSPEHFGACGKNLDWVIESLLAIVEAGATVINLPNTVERTRPTVYAEMVQRVRSAIPSYVRISTHCHDDLGMATASTVEAYFAGARQLEVTLNGLGERAGNTNLYEVAVALKANGIEVPLAFDLFYEIAMEIAQLSGIPISEKAPLIGSDAFMQRSGIHQHGAIQTFGRSDRAYSPIDPEMIGRAGNDQMEFTSQSGAAAVELIIREGGRPITKDEARLLQPALKRASETKGALTSDELIAAYDAFAEARSRKENLTPEEISMIVRDAIAVPADQVWSIVEVTANAGTSAVKTAWVRLRNNEAGEVKDGVGAGDGPVDAVINAIEKIVATDEPFKLESFTISEAAPGGSATGEARLTLTMNGYRANGVAADPDIVAAAARAYVNAVNEILVQSR